jgi:mono/diheme cytochrome c family protein
MSKLGSTIRATTIAVLMFVPAIASAQALTPEQTLKHGADMFAQTCTQSYCHGSYGAAGGAPRLANRGFTADYIEKVVTYGISGTPMAAWGQVLPLAEVRAIIAYVGSLNGIVPSTNSGPPPVLSGEAARGRESFFDPMHLQRCSSCHRVNERGLPVSPAITNVPGDAAALRAMATPQVSTATVNGDTFPALMASQTPKETKLYDLTIFPPVLRTYPPSAASMKDGSTWKHASVLGDYSDAELESILAFLRAVKH